MKIMVCINEKLPIYILRLPTTCGEMYNVANDRVVFGASWWESPCQHITKAHTQTPIMHTSNIWFNMKTLISVGSSTALSDKHTHEMQRTNGEQGRQERDG